MCYVNVLMCYVNVCVNVCGPTVKHGNDGITESHGEDVCGEYFRNWINNLLVWCSLLGYPLIL